MLEDLCRKCGKFYGLTNGTVLCVPEFAKPYSLPACKARCALFSFVDAMSFID